MADQKTGWQLEDAAAKYANDTFSARVDVKHPVRGLQDIQFQGKSLSDLSPLRISPEPPTPSAGETVIESYIRGDDLVINYAQLPSRTAKPEIYWSSIAQDGAIGIQATISMQTSLLDSEPAIRTSSHLGAGTLFQLADDEKQWNALAAGDSAKAESKSLFLFRPDDADWSYAEVLFPTDFQGAKVAATEGGLEIAFELFPEFLEKGVIRRGRVQALFMPRSNDEQVAISALNALASSPAPLTT